jgi:hypothetical protein
MKKITLASLLIILLFGCKTRNATSLKKNDVKKICDIGVDRVPIFEFLNDKDLNERDIIEDQLFFPFTIFKIYNSRDVKKEDNKQSYHYEISKHYNKDINSNIFSDKKNKYVFYRAKNDLLRLVSAEVTFNSDLIFNDNLFVESIKNENTKKYKEKANLFKIKYNNALIDIGMKKKEFAKIFEQEFNKLCDTINVHNDTDESWYLFRENTLDKIIIDSYID